MVVYSNRIISKVSTTALILVLMFSAMSNAIPGGLAIPQTGGGASDIGVFHSKAFAFGNPNDTIYDSKPPSFGEVIIQQDGMKVLANIFDEIGVKDAKLIVGKNTIPMEPQDGTPNWWAGMVPSSLLDSDTIFFKILARDYNNNIGEYSGSGKTSAENLPLSQEGAKFVIKPIVAVGQQPDPTYSIIASAERSINQNLNPQITIKNTGAEPLQNIRLMLSPELKGKFLLSDYAIKGIAPQSEATISLKLNGKVNVDAMNNPIPYKGHVIVSIDNRTPVLLELYGDIPNESATLQSIFMKMIANKAEQRYKTFEKPVQRISQDADYEVTLGSGENVIKSASDEIIIMNTGEKSIKNLRLMTSTLSHHFLLDQKNIALVPPGSFVRVKLASMIGDAELSRDLSGELVIVPENAVPVTIPINLGKKLAEDKNSLNQVKTISGNAAISNTADGIIIRNNSEEAIGNVRLILPQELARVFSLSEDSFKSIEPTTEKTIYLQPRGTVDSKVKQILNDYVGEIFIVSSNGMKKIVPVNIVWKSIASEHFVLYARDSVEELTKATQVINFLEHSYLEVAESIGEVKTKTIIYMTNSLDELEMVSDALAPSTFVYNEDVGFVWSNSEDLNMLALKEFSYRTIMHNYASYWVQQKISADKGNWLVDGVSNYIATSVVGEHGMIKNQLDSFVAQPTSFEWYGTATPSQYGASHTLFRFLTEKYGDTIIDKTLNNLGSMTVSNNRCDTIEQCALLKAVYDAKGLNINDKRYDLSFATIMEDWKEYLQENYGMMFYYPKVAVPNVT